MQRWVRESAKRMHYSTNWFVSFMNCSCHLCSRQLPCYRWEVQRNQRLHKWDFRCHQKWHLLLKIFTLQSRQVVKKIGKPTWILKSKDLMNLLRHWLRVGAFVSMRIPSSWPPHRTTSVAVPSQWILKNLPKSLVCLYLIRQNIQPTK